METDGSFKDLRDSFKKRGVFYTPKAISELLRRECPDHVNTVYDPTCGRGSLLSVFDDDVEKFGQEIDEKELEIARKNLRNFHGYHGDTLEDPGFREKKFDCIVANPPFSISWRPHIDERFKDAPCIPTGSRADFAFLLHILYFLAEGGTAVVLSFPGILYRGGREQQLRKWLLDQRVIKKIIRIPGKTFVDTPIETCCLVLSKGKKNDEIEFVDGDKSVIVNVHEIGDDCNLSIRYFFPDSEEKKVLYDPKELHLNVQRIFLENLRKNLEFDRFVCSLEGYDPNTLINQIEEILKQIREKI